MYLQVHEWKAGYHWLEIFLRSALVGLSCLPSITQGLRGAEVYSKFVRDSEHCMCFSVIYEFLSTNSVYLQVGNAELDVKEGQILDIEGVFLTVPKILPLGSYNCGWFFLTALNF